MKHRGANAEGWRGERSILSILTASLQYFGSFDNKNMLNFEQINMINFEQIFGEQRDVSVRDCTLNPVPFHSLQSSKRIKNGQTLEIKKSLLMINIDRHHWGNIENVKINDSPFLPYSRGESVLCAVLWVEIKLFEIIFIVIVVYTQSARSKFKNYKNILYSLLPR